MQVNNLHVSYINPVNPVSQTLVKFVLSLKSKTQPRPTVLFYRRRENLGTRLSKTEQKNRKFKNSLKILVD